VSWDVFGQRGQGVDRSKTGGVAGECEGLRKGERRWLSKERIVLAISVSLIKKARGLLRAWNEARAEVNGTLQSRGHGDIGSTKPQSSLFASAHRIRLRIANVS
jgi:hypothetical protein